MTGLPISVVIPVAADDSPLRTLRTLRDASEIVVVQDHEGNANVARNAGFRLTTCPFVLFSDADISWEPGALGAMLAALRTDHEAAYAYGSYRMADREHCDRPWSAEALRRNNFVSTMSLLRRERFPGFDPEIRRLQDWDLWLTILAAGGRGVYVGRRVFATDPRPGITLGGGLSWEQAREIVARKHGL